MSRTMSYYDLEEALRRTGCPVCASTSQAVDHYLDGLIYERVNDPGLRTRIRASRGFCQRHAWGLARHGAALGVAIMMRDALHVLQESLDRPRPKVPSWAERWMNRLLRRSRPELIYDLAPEALCPACAYEQEVETRLMVTFLGNLEGRDGLFDAYRGSSGFCVPHLRQTLSMAKERHAAEVIVNAQKVIWRRLEGQLCEQIRKSDFGYQDEPMGDEGASWLCSLEAVSGKGFGADPGRPR